MMRLFMVSLFCAGTVWADVSAPLSRLPLRNDGQIEAMMGSKGPALSGASALLVNRRGVPLVAVTWVGADGYFLTKASEVSALGRCRVQLPDGTRLRVREVRRDKARDLLLGQWRLEDGQQAPKVRPVRWNPAAAMRLATWVLAPGLVATENGDGPKQELKVGVISANRRAIESMGGAIGITMEDAEKGGVRIKEIVPQSPARKAGLRKDDIIHAVNGIAVKTSDTIVDEVRQLQPGDEIRVLFEREGRRQTQVVRVASREQMMENLIGDDYGNGGVSIRTDGFSDALQHDLPLGPADMGGPLFDLAGQAVGINIARTDRVTTFALPTESFRPALENWLERDRASRE